jgi:hypothetical protein
MVVLATAVGVNLPVTQVVMHTLPRALVTNAPIYEGRSALEISKVRDGRGEWSSFSGGGDEQEEDDNGVDRQKDDG